MTHFYGTCRACEQEHCHCWDGDYETYENCEKCK